MSVKASRMKGHHVDKSNVEINVLKCNDEEENLYPRHDISDVRGDEIIGHRPLNTT